MVIIRRTAIVVGEPVRLPSAGSDAKRRVDQTAAAVSEGAVAPAVLCPGHSPYDDANPSMAMRESLLAHLAQEQARARTEAIEGGHAAGYAKGLEDARGEMADVLGRLQSIVEELRRSESTALDSIADRLTELVFEAVARIMGEQSRRWPGIRGIVETALAGAAERLAVCRIRLAPDDLALLRTESPELLEAWRGQGLEAMADARIHLGGCIVEGEQSNIDARLETQMERLREVLLEAHGRPGEAHG